MPFGGTLVDDWKPICSSLDARKMVCIANSDMSCHLLVGSFTFECCIMHYILYRVWLPRSTNLPKATEEDLILMWALQTRCQIDWAHLVRYHMHKALRANAPLPYPHLVTLFLKHFKVPLTNEPSVNKWVLLEPLQLLLLVIRKILMDNGFAKRITRQMLPTNALHLHHLGILHVTP